MKNKINYDEMFDTVYNNSVFYRKMLGLDPVAYSKKEVKKEFIDWAKRFNIRPDNTYGYDVYGLFEERKGLGKLNVDWRDERGHSTDKYKLTYHPTHSTGSIFQGKTIFGQNVVGSEWIPLRDDNKNLLPNVNLANYNLVPEQVKNKDWLFVPSNNNVMTRNGLANYMSNEEKGTVLIDNRSDDLLNKQPDPFDINFSAIIANRWKDMFRF